MVIGVGKAHTVASLATAPLATALRGKAAAKSTHKPSAATRQRHITVAPDDIALSMPQLRAA